MLQLCLSYAAVLLASLHSQCWESQYACHMFGSCNWSHHVAYWYLLTAAGAVV